MSKSIKSDSCKIHYDSNFVSWTINKDSIENTLLGSSKGLLFLNVESAGEIEFQDSSCKINKKSEKVCNKNVIKFKIKNGNNSV